MIKTPIKKIRTVFTVKNKTVLTPHFIRVVFDIREDQMELLSCVCSGSNNKIFIPPQHCNIIYFPDRAREIDTELLATLRTYTNRKVDLQKRELTVDFVAHGDNGPAARWAINATAGDCLGIGIKQSDKPLVPDAEAYLLVGDATAVPVISAILEQLPEGVAVKVFLEVATREDEMPLISAATTDITWLHNPQPERGSSLSAVVKELTDVHPIPNHYVFIAAEHTTVKTLKDYFRVQLEWNPRLIYTAAYWRSGASEGTAV
ncbi:siderophore-interacting protein [Flavobacterium sp. NKUCC04_CG]|uniref:siderophore-interacting protein n=1 Tax=Flavobacterium sp. NKUCC04_CG TaxID=2842121 RepID=UPI001C5A77E8|nr:siderophore-interacting protein [Flavobacterium sp. NKUCC04_CG]MBW3519243.1 siderophore-interacting protein [Flavobacterium sp. NKUCC04_CG]